MAAPESSPDLSVVSETQAASEEQAAAETAAPSAGRAPAPGDRREGRRRGAPWWVVAVVAAAGLALFLAQYQRAEQLDAQVQSLAAELAEAGAQLAAYQSHLDAVRLGVTDLSDRVQSLKTLADADPLAPAPVDAGAAAEAGEGEGISSQSETLSMPEARLPEAAEPSGARSTAPLRGEPSSVAPLDSEHEKIVGGLLSTSFDAGPPSELP